MDAIDEEYGRRVAEGLKLDLKEVQRLSQMTPEDRTTETAKKEIEEIPGEMIRA